MASIICENVSCCIVLKRCDKWPSRFQMLHLILVWAPSSLELFSALRPFVINALVAMKHSVWRIRNAKFKPPFCLKFSYYNTMPRSVTASDSHRYALIRHFSNNYVNHVICFIKNHGRSRIRMGGKKVWLFYIELSFRCVIPMRIAKRMSAVT